MTELTLKLTLTLRFLNVMSFTYLFFMLMFGVDRGFAEPTRGPKVDLKVC